MVYYQSLVWVTLYEILTKQEDHDGPISLTRVLTVKNNNTMLQLVTPGAGPVLTRVQRIHSSLLGKTWSGQVDYPSLFDCRMSAKWQADE